VNFFFRGFRSTQKNRGEKEERVYRMAKTFILHFPCKSISVKEPYDLAANSREMTYETSQHLRIPYLSRSFSAKRPYE